MKNLDDFNLIRIYAEERSETAFRELVSRHSAAVFAVCRRRLRDVHFAEDATQRTFMILARKARDVRNLPIRPYLFRIATGCCADIRKERVRRKRREVHLIDSYRMTAESKQTRMLTAAMEEAFEHLATRYRDAIELRYVLDFSVPEVAEALSISVPAAKQRLVRGLAELRSRLAGSSALCIMILPQMLQLLKPEVPAGLARRTADAVLHAKLSPSGGGTDVPVRRHRPYLQVGTVCAVAGAAIAVTLPQLLRPGPQPILATTAPVRPAPMLPPKPPAAPSTRPNLTQKLHMPYMPNNIRGIEFEEAIGFISVSTGVEVKCDWPSIEAVGIPRTSRIEAEGAEGDVLSEFNRIVKAADDQGRLECVVKDDFLLIRAKN
jgi:RNA polymerase sigma factor (sigma-70 family)